MQKTMPVLSLTRRVISRPCPRADVYMLPIALLFSAFLFAGCGGKEPNKTPSQLEQIQQTVSGAASSANAALNELQKLSPDDAVQELKKLRQWEYQVLRIAPDVPRVDLEKMLNDEGRENWDCFNVQQMPEPGGKIAYTVFCKRHPETPLSFVPQSILGR